MRRRYAAGLAAQGFASGTTVVLGIVAGHASGPDGLGRVFAGFASFTAMSALLRALVTTPLIASSSAAPSESRQYATSAAFSVVLVVGAASSLVFIFAGMLVGGVMGKGLLLFGPWLLPALLQQLFRATLFRDGRTRVAVVNDFAWFAAMVISAPVAIARESEWVVVACWGLGATLAAALAWRALRPRPAPIRRALGWATREAAQLGAWLTAQEVVSVIASYATIAVMAKALGSGPLGGLRAAETAFAPFSLLGPALALTGLPALARAGLRGRVAARKLALLLSAFATAIAVVYLAVAIVLSDRLLVWLFGPEFDAFGDLVWPMAAWQLTLTAGLGFGILLQAERRGAAVLVSGMTGSIAGLIAVAVLAPRFGAEGAAWAYALAGLLGATVTTTLALLPRPRRTNVIGDPM